MGGVFESLSFSSLQTNLSPLVSPSPSNDGQRENKQSLYRSICIALWQHITFLSRSNFWLIKVANVPRCCYLLLLTMTRLAGFVCSITTIFARVLWSSTAFFPTNTFVRVALNFHALLTIEGLKNYGFMKQESHASDWWRWLARAI